MDNEDEETVLTVHLIVSMSLVTAHLIKDDQSDSVAPICVYDVHNYFKESRVQLIHFS